jgi:hypothetical protein
MADDFNFTDELLAKVTGGLLTTSEDRAEVAEKLDALCNRLAAKYGREKTYQAIWNSSELAAKITAENVLDMLNSGEIEQTFEAAILALPEDAI